MPRTNSDCRGLTPNASGGLRMDRAQQTGWVVVLLGASAVIVLGIAYQYGFSPYLGAAILAAIAAAVQAWIVWWRDRPHMRMSVVPHRRGWCVPSEKEEDYLLVDSVIPGEPGHFLPIRDARTHKERSDHGMHLSQAVESYWLSPSVYPNQRMEGGPWEPPFAILQRARSAQRELVLKFGVVEVKNDGADAKNCRILMSFRRQGETT
jgi:hypothetical protein